MADQFPFGRALVVAGTLAAVLLGGCGTPTMTPPDGGNGTGSSPTQSAESPSPSAPVRSVTAANLLTIDDIPIEDPISMAVVETPDGEGRTVQQSYSCLPVDGLASLGASAMVTRNFAYKIIDAEADPNPDSPLKNQPVIYTQALQFPDAATATAAAETYLGWVRKCPTELNAKGYTIDTDQSFAPSKVKVSGAAAKVGMTAYVKPGDTDAENLYWESAGVTRVGDRVMITITLSWGMDTPGTLDESDGDFIHPQVALVEEGAVRLAA